MKENRNISKDWKKKGKETEFTVEQSIYVQEGEGQDCAVYRGKQTVCERIKHKVKIHKRE